MADNLELKACRECGAECRIEHFEGPHIEGRVSLWVCSNHKRFGGDCPSDLAYFDADAWNTRTPTPPAGDVEWATKVEELVELLALTADYDTRCAMVEAFRRDALAAGGGERMELRQTLSDCAEFLADIDGDLAGRCETELEHLGRAK